jgi:RHS repeat-associated protein
MKKVLLGIGAFALATATVTAQYNPCVAYSVTNCAPPPSLTLASVSPITLSVCSTVSASTTVITNAGYVVVTNVDESCALRTNTIATNYPTLESNWTVVYWNNQSTTNAGLSVAFTPTNAWSGTITFYAKYRTPRPCAGTYTATNSVSVTATNCAPGITAQPASQTVAAGNTVTFNVAACGTATLNYQWRFNGASLPGATASSYSLSNVQLTNAGSYAVVVTNLAGSVSSSNALLTVLVPPSITTQPASQTVLQGSNATFNVVATGTLPLSYQWTLNGQNISGATGTAYTRTNVQPTDAGTYSVVVTNAVGSVSSAGAALTVNVPPLITTQPANQAVEQGTNIVTFSVVATGTAPLSYQWYFNSTLLNGETASSLALSNVTTNNAGSYLVIVTNSAGSITSSNALLTVYPPCTGPASGIISWWPGDGNANDIVSTNNGVLEGGATANAVGVVGSAFSFDGTNGYVEILDAPSLDPTNLTIEAWVQFASLNSWVSGAPEGQQYIVFKQNSQTSYFEGYNLVKLRTTGGDVLSFIVSSSAGQVALLQSTTLVTTGVWYHVAGVRGSNFTQLYVNGQLESQTNVSFPQDYGTLPLYFGTSGQPSYWDGKLAGMLDEVSLYNRALSSAEIQAIYNAGSQGKCLPPLTVSLITPADGATVLLPANPALAACASPARKAASVEFFADGLPIGQPATGANGCYACLWTNPSTGNHALTAVATDIYGFGTTSQVAHVTIQNASFVKGINLNGPAVVIEGNQWTNYAGALANGLSLQGGTTNFLAFTPIGADGDTATMLQSMIISNRLPPLSAQTNIQFTYNQPATNNYDRWMTVTNVPAGYLVTNGYYRAWCVQYNTADPTGNYLCNLYYSYGSPDSRFPGRSYNEVNYIVNNTNGFSSEDIQCAIWTVLGSNPSILPENETNYQALVAAANANANYVPGPTNYVAVVVEAGPNANGMAQPFVIVIPPTSQRAIGFTLTQTLPNGTYSVYLWLAENQADHLRSLNITVQGATVASGVDDLPLGRWAKVGPFTTNVTTGTLTVGVASPCQGDPLLMGLAIYGAVTNQPPTVQITPTNQAVCPGLTATFYATNTTGTSPLYYQWQINNTPLAGQTNASLTVSNVAAGSAGIYTVIVTNLAGSASNSATLTVWTNVLLVAGPASTNVCPGMNATFSVAASGTISGYQWRQGTNVLSGQTNSSLVLTNVGSTNAGSYCVTVSGLCSTSSPCASLTVNQSVVITNAPVSLTNRPRTNATFTVGASGTISGYQWLQGTNVLSGRTNSSLVLTNVSASDAGTYWVTVSGPCNSTNAWATLTVECLPSPGGLVGWWQGETNGDEAVNGNNATLYGVTFTNGEVGSAFYFGGWDSLAYAYVPGSSNLDVGPGPGLTIECWIDPNDLTTAGPLVGWDDGGGDSRVALWVNWTDSGALSADLYDADWNGNTLFSAPGVLTAGSFQHVAVTYNQSNGLAVLYCNGTVVAAQNLGSLSPLTASDLYLGGNPGWQAYYSGRLDEVGVYNRALEASEIAAIYDAANLGRCGIPPSWIVQPASQSAMVSNNATFCSLAVGTWPLAYQWFSNSNAIVGATSPWLTLTNLQTNNAGTYSVQASNAVGTITSTNAILTVNPAVCCPAPSGLVSWWPGEGDGTDSAGTNNISSLDGITFAAGEVGQGFSFDGNAHEVLVPDAPDLNFGANQDFTIEAWIQPQVETTTDGIMSMVDKRYSSGGTDSPQGYEFCLSYGQVHARFLRVGFGPAGPDLRDGQFHHIAWTLSRAFTTGGNLYVDGSVVLTFDPTPYTGTLSNTQPLRLGNHADSTFTTFFKGVMDEVSIYRRALSSNEIQAIYNASFMGKCGLPPTITVQPANRNVGLGSTAAFTVSATGTPQLHYQWWFNGTNLPGATLTALTLTNVQWAQAGTYAVQVTNAFGSALSSNAVLTITNSAVPVVQITNPVNQTLLARTTNAVIATVTTLGVSNTWVQFFIGTNISTATNTIGFAFIPTNGAYQVPWQPVLGGTYILTAFVTNTSGANAWSAPVTNTVRNLPAVTITSPTNNAVFGPAPTNITITATATAYGATITNVGFYQSTNFLGSNSSAPYSILWNSVAAGTYTLTARAADSTGAIGTSWPVEITVEPVNQPPSVYAGPDQTNNLNNPTYLAGTVSDDGLPYGSHLSIWWSRISGPGTATFANSNQPVTTVTFSTIGTNVLQLSASDSQYTVSSNVTITVWPSNQPPVVNAGTNQILVWPAPGVTNLILQLTPITTESGYQLVGVDYLATSNGIVVAHGGFDTSGSDTNFDIVSPVDGSVTPFSSVTGLGFEPQLASVRDTFGGFKIGELFSAGNGPGEILRIAPDGSLVTNANNEAWVVLDDGTDAKVKGLYVDRTGVFGGDLIAVNMNYDTYTGDVWRINSRGQATSLAQISLSPQDSVTLVTVPNNVAKYGPWAGRILVSDDSELTGLYAVDTNGTSVLYPEFAPPCIQLIPANENLYAVMEDNNLYTAPAAAFQGMEGDILMTECVGQPEEDAFFRVRWKGQAFEQSLMNPQWVNPWWAEDWEQITFAPVGMGNLPPVPNSVQLNGCVTDDGLILPHPIIAWVQVSGPAPVTFADPTQTNTTATFTQPGAYVLQLTANDGEFTRSSNVTIQIIRNQPPVVNAGTNQIITGTSTTLQGTVTDDGWPSNQLTITWSQVAGPTNGASIATTNYVTSSTNVSVTTSVTFNTIGTYIFQLAASDGQAASAAQVMITSGQPQLTLTPAYAGLFPTNSPQTFTATLVDAGGAPIVRTNVIFTVTGANASTAPYTNSTDTNGSVQFTNAGSAGGRDFVQASATVGSAAVASLPAIVDWGLNLACGDVYQGDIDSTDCVDTVVSAQDLRYADYFFFNGQAGTQIALGYTINIVLYGVDPDLVLILMDSSNQVVDFSVGSADTLVDTLPYTGTFLIELTTFDNDSDLSFCGDYPIPYSLSLSCSNGNINVPMMAVLLNGTNVPNGGTLVLGPTTTNNVPASLSLVVTNWSAADLLLEDLQTNGDFQASLDTALPVDIPPTSNATLTVTFNAPTNGVSVGSLSISNNTAAQQYVLTLIGEAFPPGNPPGIQLISPANNATFYAPASIPIAAAVTTNGTDGIAYVRLLASTTSGASTIGSLTNVPYNLTWPNVPAGDYTITGAAVDTVGRSAVSTPITVHVLDPGTNRPPVASNDQFTVFANSTNNVLYPLANDYDPNGYPLTIIAIQSPPTPNHGAATIINNGTAICYTPPPGVQSPPGSPGDGFSYQITDGRGGTAWGGVLINIFAGDLPQVQIINPPGNITTNAGAIVPITAQVTNTPYIARVEFFLGQTSLGTVSNGTNGLYTLNWTALFNGGGTITATAYDSFGQYNTSPAISITVTNIPGTYPPIASLITYSNASVAMGMPFTNGVVVRNGIFDLYGQAGHPQGSNDVTWQLSLNTPDGTFLRDLTPQSARTPEWRTTNSVFLATCDLTTIINGVYDLKLVVTGGYGVTETNVQFMLDSNLKIGQFSFSQQDLALPINGIPLTVVRTYNSINPTRGDFGYGWTYSLMDMQASIDETRADTVDSDGEIFSQRTGGGRDVTLTLPDGRTVTFQFYFNQGGTIGSYYYAAWQSPPDVNYTLTANGNPYYDSFTGYWNEEAYTDFDSFDFSGFTLKALDNTRYILTREDLGVHDIENGAEGYEVQAWGNLHLSQIIQPTGDTITITLNSVVHTDAMGLTNRAIVFQRDNNSLITAITDPSGLGPDGNPAGPPALQYQYDANQNLLNVLTLQDRSNGGVYVTNSFTYTNATLPHYITAIINADGTQVAENFYDDSGRLIAVQDANGNLTQFVHNLTNNLEVVIDRLNRTNSYVYDLCGNVIAQTNALGQITTMTYDGNNNKTNEVAYLNGQPYATNNYVYSTTNLLLSASDPLGDTSLFTYDNQGHMLTSTDARANTTTSYYDSQTGNLLGTSDALGNSTTNFYDPQGLPAGSEDAAGTLATNSYDGSDNLIATATLDVSGNLLSTNSFTYDANGNRLTSTVWRRVNGFWTSATTTNIYDAMNRVVQTIDPDGGTNTVVYNSIGKQQATIDKLGRTNSYTYDNQGRLIQTIYPDQTTETSAYDAVGNRTSSVDRLGRTTTYVYDALNRLVQTVYPDNTTNTTVYDGVGRVAQSIDARGTTNAFGYDAAGRRVAVTNAWGTSVQMTNGFAFDPNGNQIAATDALGRTTTNVFDALNRVVQVLYPDGTKTATGYDSVGRRVAQTNQDRIITLFGYDGAGRLLAVTNALDTGQQTVTQYQYDEAGNQTNQVDALGRTTSFAYDSMGRRIARTLPGNQVETLGYDLAGNLVRATNFNGVVITNQYDVMNRLVHQASVNGYAVSYTYTPTGQRLTMTDAAGTTTNSYDSRDRLVQKMVSWSSGPVVFLNYAYDADGNVTNLWSSTTGGANLQYAYDPLNRITNVLAGGSAAASYGFDGVGNLQSIRYANGVTNLYQYDALNRLTNALWRSHGSNVASFYYQLGATGNRTNLTETVAGASTPTTYAWQYDPLYRLTNETISALGTLGYRYDPVGNRTNRQSSGGLASTLPSAAGAFTINDWLTTDQYDNNGNTLWSTNGTAVGPYYYDVQNRLTNYNNSVYLAYNGDGIRVRKTADGSTTFYVVDDRNPSGYAQVLEELTSAGALIRAYAYGLSLISQREAGGTVYYFGADGHGSTRLLLDGTGAVNQTFTYDAYGTLIASKGLPATAYLYCGEQFDSDLGMYYLRARYFNAGTGRFWTRDSYEGNKQDPLSLHKYLYCGANPVDRIDPLGLKLIPPSGKDDRANYEKAIEYLSHSAKGKEILDKLQACENQYVILAENAPSNDFDEPGDAYSGALKTVYWVPDLGLRWRGAFGGWKQITPALCLMHELGHAYHQETDPARYRTDSKPYDPPGKWESPEEKRDIIEIENVVAKQLGEAQRHRDNYPSGWEETYDTAGPTTTARRTTPYFFLDPGNIMQEDVIDY